MKTIYCSKYLPDSFVFDDAYVLNITRNALLISTFDSHELTNPKITEPSIQKCPKIEIKVIGTNTLRELVNLKNFVLSIESSELGVVKHNDNYSVCADGAYWRRIKAAKISGSLNGVELELIVSVEANPVETLVTSQPPGPLSESDKLPFSFLHKFIVPVVSIPELMDMNREEAHRFKILTSANEDRR
jgi:hypothetical protein